MKESFTLPLSKSTVPLKKARPSQHLNGSGIVTTGRGREISVEYHLFFPQNDPKVPDQDPSKLPPKEFSGQVWCPYDGSFVSVHAGKTMTLKLEDGRRLRFLHSNRDGGIAVLEWLG